MREQVAASDIEDHQAVADSQRLRKSHDADGVVFYANSLIHGFSWSMPNTIANKRTITFGETTVSSVQRLGKYADTNAGDAPGGNAWQTAL